MRLEGKIDGNSTADRLSVFIILFLKLVTAGFHGDATTIKTQIEANQAGFQIGFDTENTGGTRGIMLSDASC